MISFGQQAVTIFIISFKLWKVTPITYLKNKKGKENTNAAAKSFYKSIYVELRRYIISLSSPHLSADLVITSTTHQYAEAYS